MNSILKLANAIRNMVNESDFLITRFQNDRDAWSILCVAMDVLEDSQ